MFFKKTQDCESISTGPELQWKVTEVYDKRGKDSKLLRTEKELQFRRNWDKPWESAWHSYNNPIYIEDSK